MREPRWSLDGVPEKPGVYLFKNDEDRVLYVGKARVLRSRLRSYRRPGGDGRLLIQFLEADAASVETIVTRTEQEALLLEDALIKQHKPPHNIRLKDDKSFLMLRLDLGESFPRFKFVRAHNPKKSAKDPKGRSRFFGPFASSRAVRHTLSDLHRVVPLRDCPDSIFNNRSRPCIKHQIGLCSAPCVGLIDKPEYDKLLERAVTVLSGDPRELEADLEQRMQRASEELEYERAATWRDRLAALRRTVQRQGVRPRDEVDRDVLGLARSGERATVHRLAFREGRLAESRTHHFRSQLPEEELLDNVLSALYSGGRRDAPAELVLPVHPAEEEFWTRTLRYSATQQSTTAEGESTKIVVPSGGERQRMLDWASENARTALVRDEGERNDEEAALEQLASLANLPSLPDAIDCFDISNFQGSNTVASRVRFRGGIPDRSGYRRYKIKTVDGQDDFGSMEEVLGRSLKSGVRDGDLPDLIVIDGGLGQLNAALKARSESGAFEVPMLGLAKARAERTIRGRRKSASEERIYLPGAKAPIDLPKHSAAKHLLERLRDEAHRFAITYHRKERGKITSQLDSIPGVGDTRRKALIRRFGSVVGVREASVEDIAAVPGIGRALAEVIRDQLAKEK